MQLFLWLSIQSEVSFKLLFQLKHFNVIFFPNPTSLKGHY